MDDTKLLLKEASNIETMLRDSNIETSLQVARLIRKLRHEIIGKERAITKLSSMIDKKDNSLVIRMNLLEQRISHLESK